MAQHDITHARQSAFHTVLANAEPGDEIIYHIGEFCAGPHKQVALLSAEAGMCILYQRRGERRNFVYIARKPKRK
jgi:MinD-like ATPase involved in chromosome partitioning or flagellar assembly